MTDPCDDWALLVQADIDSELDIPTSARVAHHVETCAACAALQVDMITLSQRLRAEIVQDAAPPALIRPLQIAAAQRLERRRRAAPLFGGFGAGVALAAGLAGLILLPTSDPNAALIDGHIRALQPGHLVDVVSTDTHTVKPWFDGRVDFAPDVRDFAADGFPLTGGRLDYVSGRTVAVLIYQRAKHPIDVFVWPNTGTTNAALSVSNAKGYAIARWTADGMQHVAISDISADDMTIFAKLWQSR